MSNYAYDVKTIGIPKDRQILVMVANNGKVDLQWYEAQFDSKLEEEFNDEFGFYDEDDNRIGEIIMWKEMDIQEDVI